ncbi:hypothetical protein MasN3_12000 [Massilia varians]|uniref:histidine kinase n=1 Tax=Massilia varians TaxID=457921 RepID=A0ABN6T7S5_9BURK|nr:PAS domain S-box protein [Massilia varians]BDT57706.1 hypothetical protein MasN3_12000 [Massilia varians]
MSPTAATGAGATSHAYPEVRFRELFEQAPVSLQILDPQGYTMRVSRAWEALWQIHEGSALKRHVMSRDYNLLLDPQLVATGVAACLARAMAGESVEIPAIHYDTAALGTSGRARWVTARAHPIKDPQGKVVGVMLMHEDITERVLAEKALREREERFRTLAMATSQIVWSSSANGEILEDSPSWRAFTGQRYEEWRGDGWLDAVHPDDRARTCQTWDACIAGRAVYETEYRLRRADGSYRWTAVKGIPLLAPDGSVREWVGANRDIHDSVTQQEGLLQRLDSERRQSALLAKVAGAARTLHTALSSEDIADALAQEVRAILGAAEVEVALDGGTRDPSAAGDAACDSLALPLLDRREGASVASGLPARPAASTRRTKPSSRSWPRSPPPVSPTRGCIAACASRTGARTSSSRCWPTSCAIRWR